MTPLGVLLFVAYITWLYCLVIKRIALDQEAASKSLALQNAFVKRNRKLSTKTRIRIYPGEWS